MADPVVAAEIAITAAIVATRRSRTRGVFHSRRVYAARAREIRIGIVLIQIRFREAIASGEVTLTFRRWKRPQVVPGNTYRTAAGRIVVDAVDVVDPRTHHERRRRSGPDSRRVAELLRELRGRPTCRRIASGSTPRPGPIRVRCSPRPRALSGDEVADLRRRLERLDRASSHGPWTNDVLQAIAARPAVRAARSRRGLRARDATVQARRAQAEEPRADAQPRRRLPAVAARRGVPRRDPTDRV